MRKHFLILMLMALLPLAGWASDFKDATVVVEDITYGSATDPTVVSATIGGYDLLTTGTGALATWNDGVNDHAIFYTSNACTTAVKVNVGTDDERYAFAAELPANNTYYIKVVPTDPTAHTGFAAGDFFVHKATLHLTVRNADNSADWSLVKVWDGLTVSEELMDSEDYFLTATEALPAGFVLNPSEVDANHAYLFDGSALLMSYTGTDATLNVAGGAFPTVIPAHEITFSGLESDNYDLVIANAELNIKQKDLLKITGALADGVTITATGLTTTYNNEEQFPTYTVKVGGVTLTEEEFANNFALTSYSNTTRTTAHASIDKGTYYIKLAARDAEYNFTSYSAATAGTEYGNGVAYLRNVDATWAYIEVKENEFDASWEGKIYKIKIADLANARQQLYGNGENWENETAIPVYVAITSQALRPSNFVCSYYGTEAAADQANYKLTINPAVVFVKGKKTEVIYKGSKYKKTDTAAALGLDYEYTGLFAGTTIGTKLPTLKIHDDITNVGTITIDLTDPDGGYDNPNYTVALDQSGIFEVKPAALTLTAKNKYAITGEAPTFSLADVTVAGKQGSDNFTGLVTAEFVDGFTFEGKAAGVYPDVVKVKYTQTTTNVLHNYTITVGEELGDLTIGNGKIYITADALEKTYGAADPEFTFTVVKPAGATLTTNPVFEREDADNQNVGQYKIVLKTPATAPANYDIEYTTAPVYFTINPAPLTITALPQVIDPAGTVAAATDALDQTAVAWKGFQYDDDAANIVYALAAKDGVDYNVDGTKANAIEINVPAFADLAARLAWAADPANAGKLNANYNITVVPANLIVGDATAVPTIVLPSDKSTLMGLLNYYDGKEVNAKVEVIRNRVVAGSNFKWTAKKWNTLVLPFDATIAQISNAFGYAVVNVVDPSNTEINDKGKLSVKFRLEMDDVEANTPFTLKTTDALEDIVDVDGCVTFNNVTIVAPETAYPSVDAGLGSTLVGVYEETALNSENPGMFLNSDQWYNISSTSSNNVKIEEFDAYVDKGTNAARDFEFVFQELDGSTTSISTVSADNMKSSAAEGWFTVNGIKLNSMPTEKGVYINNGKKVVIK